VTPHVLYCDGASRGNPGPSSIGVVLLDGDGQVVRELSGVIGEATNNVAEYRALEAGLEIAADLGVEHLEVRLDSELLVKQVSGEYRVKSAHLKPLHRSVLRHLARIPKVTLSHVPRARNARADALANEALDDLETG
jgi:ribonuclease HI